jgi:ankyrin repeat protein
MKPAEYEKCERLIDAIGNNDYDAVLSCINDGADVTAINMDNIDYVSPMHIATQYADARIIQLLLDKGADIDTNPDDHPLGISTPFRWAISRYNMQEVKKILQFNPDIEFIGPGNCCCKDQTPLQVAISTGSLKMVNLLLDAGANVNAFVDRYETERCIETPLITAFTERSEDMALRLIEADAKLDTVSFHGSTLLHCATSYPQVMRKLIDYGLDVNAMNKEGDTPLHVAVFGCDRESAELLIEQGANLEATNHKGVTPLQLAAYDAARGGMRSKTGIFALLLDRGANFDKEQCLAYITQHHNQSASMNPHFHPNPTQELRKMTKFINLTYTEYRKAKRKRTVSRTATFFDKPAAREKSVTQSFRRKRPKRK